MIPCYSCHQPVPEGTPVCPGCQALLEVNGYRLTGILGQGGGGAVYQARVLPAAAVRGASSVAQVVALKQSLDAVSLRQLQREFTVLRTLRHANLPRYYECFEEAGHGYLAMEFIPGQNLAEVLDRHSDGLPESQVLGYAVQLCDVLGYLHGQTPPILHRDIKPANIRLTPDGLIKLVDFGLLKQGTGQTRLSIQGFGTVEYAPLEQYGRGGSTDPRSDVYSLAATLYHLLTGQPPEDAITRVTSAYDSLRSPRDYRPDLAPHVAAALLHGLALRPENRVPDIWQFEDELLSQRSAPSIAPDQPTRLLAADPDRPPLAQPIGPISDATAAYVTCLGCLPAHHAPVVSVVFAPDGKTFASADVEGNIYICKVADAYRQLEWNRSHEWLSRIAFSPDGQILASSGQNPALQLWRVADGTLLGKLRPGGRHVHSLAWTPDGRLLASGNSDNSITLWDPAKPHPVQILNGPKYQRTCIRGLVFTPSGDLLVSASEDGTVQIWDVDTGELLRTLTKTALTMLSVAFAPSGQVLAATNGAGRVLLWLMPVGELYSSRSANAGGSGAALAFSPDGQVLTVASYDRVIRLIRVSDGRTLGVLTGHTDEVTSVAFSADGRMLVSGSADHTIRFWGVR